MGEWSFGILSCERIVCLVVDQVYDAEVILRTGADIRKHQDSVCDKPVDSKAVDRLSSTITLYCTQFNDDKDSRKIPHYDVSLFTGWSICKRPMNYQTHVRSGGSR
jgi:hypothetical protein